jgi:hemolysin activation/secretion protein
LPQPPPYDRVAGIAALAIALVSLSLAAFAQQLPRAPDAGRILQEVTPPPSVPRLDEPSPALPEAPPRRPSILPAGGPKIQVKQVKFRGNRAFTEQQLDEAVHSIIQQPVGGAELQLIENRITELYQNEGYFLAQAYFEPQDVSAGIVTLSILEGKLGRVRVERAPEAPVPDRLVNGLLARVKPGQPLRQQDLERAMLLLSDTPGIAPEAFLEAGVEPGTTDLVIEINEGRRFRASVDADNYGSYYTGYYRLGALLRFLSPLGLGDVLDIRPLVTSNSGILFGSIGYDLPLGTQGTRLSLGVSSLTYELGHDLEELGGKGYARTADLAVTMPIVRQRSENLFGRFAFDYKLLQDRYDEVDFKVDKTILLTSLGLNYEQRDALLGGGYTNLASTFYFGSLDIRNETVRDIDTGPFGPDTHGAFMKIGYALSRLQQVRGPVTAFVGVTGQFAGNNLDSAEQISLGGPQAVRAYPISEGVVDQGTIATGELRLGVTPDITLSVFYDAAWGNINKDSFPGSGDNNITLRGYGVGFLWVKPGRFSLRATAAWRDTGPPESDPNDDVPRLFGQLVVSF